MIPKRWKHLGLSAFALALAVSTTLIPRVMAENSANSLPGNQVAEIKATEKSKQKRIIHRATPLTRDLGMEPERIYSDEGPIQSAGGLEVEPELMPPPSPPKRIKNSTGDEDEFLAGDNDAPNDADERKSFIKSERKQRKHGRFETDINPEQVRLEFKNNMHSQEFQEVLDKSQRRGNPILQSERIQSKKVPSVNHMKSASESNNITAQKLSLAPLPVKTLPKQADCRQSGSMEDLKEKISSESVSRIRERDLLLLAGKYVGQDDWEAAREIYEELEENSKDQAVLEAVQRNLEVVNQKLAYLSETDPIKKETLELELANLHQDLGHKRAAKRIYRRLAKTAGNSTVRHQATELLSNPSSSGRPVKPLKLRQSD